MPNVTVSEEALRELVREVLDNKDLGRVRLDEETNEEPVKVNDVVDPSAALTDPGNPNYKPNNRVELQVAVKALSDDLPAEKVSDVYEKLVGALKVSQEKDEDGKNKMKTKDTQAESIVRQAIRKHLEEAEVKTEAYPPPRKFVKKEKNFGPIVGPLPPVTKIPTGVHGGEYMRKFEKSKGDLKKILKQPLPDEDFGGGEATGDALPAKGKNLMMTDVSGASFQDIAKELGFSVAGAKQAVDKALLKAQWAGQMYEEAPEDMDIIVLTSMNDYIKMLSKSGELSAADIQLMKDHPDIVRELDGFRDFLDRALRKARKGSKLENPLGESAAPVPSRRTIKKGNLTIVLETTGAAGMTKKCKFCGQDIKTVTTSAGEYFDAHTKPDGSDCHGSKSRTAAAAVSEAKNPKKGKLAPCWHPPVPSLWPRFSSSPSSSTCSRT